MNRLISMFVVMVIFFTSATTRANEISLTEIPDAVLTPLEQGEKAPYQGVLLSDVAIATIIAEYKAFEESLKIEIDKANAESEARKKFEIENLTATCDADKKILFAQIEDDKRREKILLDRQKKLENSSNKSVVTWTLIGVGAGALITLAGFMKFLL